VLVRDRSGKIEIFADQTFVPGASMVDHVARKAAFRDAIATENAIRYSGMREPRFESSNRPLAHVARYALWLAAALALPGGAQNFPSQPRTPLPQPIGQRVGDSVDGFGVGDPTEQEERLRMLNRERQKSLISDTNKLLKLAGELDIEIQKGNPGALSSSQLRKLESIEKLAHSVKDKMSYSVRGPAINQPQPPYTVVR
jgi:hypothetical protein